VIPYTDQFPAVTVVTPSSSLARFTTFEMSMEALLVPSGSHLSRTLSANIALNCNEPVRLNKTPYYWFIDDDHQFEPFTLLRLMAHDVPVVVPVTCLKDPPFHPVLYKGEQIGPNGYKQFIAIPWQEIEEQVGLMDVFACGRSGLLVKREVFDVVPWPWFRMGQFNPEHAGEDIWFCEKLREANIPIKVDTDLFFGHIGPVAAYPKRRADGRICIHLVWANGQSIVINRPDIPAVPTPMRDQKGNLIAERMAHLRSMGHSEAEAFEMAMKEAEERVPDAPEQLL
jgi:hypothetical protein